MRNLGGTPYYNINTTYTDANGSPVPNSVSYTQYWANNTNAPTGTQNVSDTSIQNMIVSGSNTGKITYDPSTVYTVFSPGAVNLGGGFGGPNFQYCAYHGAFNSSRGTVLYAVMPYNYAYPNSCSALGAGAPNDDPGAARPGTTTPVRRASRCPPAVRPPATSR